MTKTPDTSNPRQTSESEDLGDALPENWYATLKAAYPKRDGGGAAPRAIERLVRCALANGAKWDRILAGARNYKGFCAKKGNTGTEFVQMLQTFVGRDWHFEEWADQDMRTPAEIAAERQWADLEARAKAMGYQTVDRARGYRVALYAIEQAEKDPPKLRVVK